MLLLVVRVLLGATLNLADVDAAILVLLDDAYFQLLRLGSVSVLRVGLVAAPLR